MRILITNDDGVWAPGIRVLAEYAKKLGEVTVVAPKTEQSGKSHAIDFTRPIEIKAVDFMDGVRAFSMDSTPADCVRFAVLGLKEHFDLVLSGVNRGFNLGLDIVYSGTAGAIFEAGRLGLRGIAISTEPDGFDAAEMYLDKVFSFIEQEQLLMQNSLYNVNIPRGSGEIYVTRQGGIYFTDDFVKLEGDMYEQVGGIAPCESEDLSYDTVAVISQKISITPLVIEKTNLAVFEKYKGKCKV